MVQPADAAERSVRDVPGHAVVAEIGQGVAQGRQFPVQHRDDARLVGVEHQVVQAVVAVDDGNHALVARRGRDVRRQPFDQLFHLGNGLAHGTGTVGGSLVLLAPAADLPVEVISGLAVAGQAPVGEFHGVQGGDDAVHLVVDFAALGRRHAGQGLVPEHPAGHELHHVEGAADHRLVLAQAVHARNRHVGAVQPAHHGELALDGVRRRQQFRDRPRLGAHHEAALRRDQLVGGVGLSALEHLHRERAGKTFQVLRQPGRQGADVDGVLAGDRAGADEMIELAQRIPVGGAPVLRGSESLIGYCSAHEPSCRHR